MRLIYPFLNGLTQRLFKKHPQTLILDFKSLKFTVQSASQFEYGLRPLSLMMQPHCSAAPFQKRMNVSSDFTQDKGRRAQCN